MRTAVCYYSRHHGNTRKVLEAMAREGEIDLIDATVCQTVRLEDYDCVGFASGVYFGKFHTSVLHAARQYLPHGKPVFFVCTYGGGMGQSTRELKELASSPELQKQMGTATPVDTLKAVLLPGGTIPEETFPAALGIQPAMLPEALAKGEFSSAIGRVLGEYVQAGDITQAEQRFTEERIALLKDGDDSTFSIGPIACYLMQRETEARELRVLFAQKL